VSPDLLDDLDDAVRIPRSAHTLRGFRQWMASKSFPQYGRISFLGGEIDVDMSPEDIITHNDPKAAITVALAILIEAEDLGRFYVDGACFINVRADVSNEPDFMFCRWDTLLSKRVRFRSVSRKHRKYAEVIGSPDLVVEILSDSSVCKDRQELYRRYFAAAVAEYWLIDCRSDQSVDFQMHTRGKRGFRRIAADRDGFWPSKVLPGRFRLTRTRDRLGLWKHRLESRPVSQKK
jgi:Uma2 family endonuclease